MMVSATDPAPERDSRSVPDRECDVVMKGGITSGVIYPYSLHRIAETYRVRSIGGASAGAIGAAAGAAAELGRRSGGYERLREMPEQLGGGRLADLFHPQPETEQLLSLMLAVNGADRSGPAPKGFRRVLAVVVALLRAFPLANALGTLLGIALLAVGVTSGGLAGWLLALAGVLVGVVGLVVALVVRLARKLTVDVPRNMFGICRGSPGFTDWLGEAVDSIAGLSVSGPPLTFGQLWQGDSEVPTEGERQIDLRMITTCVSEGRPYELPWEAFWFFFDPDEWRRLFPERVVRALEDAPQPQARTERDTERWRWEESCGAFLDDGTPAGRKARQRRRLLRRRQPDMEVAPRRLCRLPDAEHLPVIVATRLSLSFPLLISAVPLYAVDWRHPKSEAAVERYRVARRAGLEPPPDKLQFTRLWFSDGGFCSNFPVHFFDAALPARPTFAINLGRFPEGQGPELDVGFELAKDNKVMRPAPDQIPTSGVGAVAKFASAAVNTARNWQDSSHLGHPGYRDRIVRILQTAEEGGINLHMDGDTITGLGERGRAAAEAMVEQFTEPRYRLSTLAATGWDNHRWVRYRALLSVLPDWLETYRHGRDVLRIDSASPPSYDLDAGELALAKSLTDALDELARVVETADPADLEGLKTSPYPVGVLRRLPRT